MDKIKLAFSSDLKSGKAYELLKEFLINEENEKSDVNYSNMLIYDNDEIHEPSAYYSSSCFIYTNFFYKSHFTLVNEKKNDENSMSYNHENCKVFEENESNQSEDDVSAHEKYYVSLILLIVNGDYLQSQYDKEKNIFYKIEKLQKEYKDVRILCIFIGLREILNRSDLSENYKIQDINNEQNIIINAKDLDVSIATLLIHHLVDTIELDNIMSLHKCIFKCCKYVYQSKIRKPNSYFKVKPTGMNQVKNSNINETQNNAIWISQLMQITGISEDTSKRIAELFNSPFDLIKHFKKNNNEECLKDVIINSSYGKRKLGKALSRKIYRVFSSHSNSYQIVS